MKRATKRSNKRTKNVEPFMGWVRMESELLTSRFQNHACRILRSHRRSYTVLCRLGKKSLRTKRDNGDTTDLYRDIFWATSTTRIATIFSPPSVARKKSNFPPSASAAISGTAQYLSILKSQHSTQI